MIYRRGDKIQQCLRLVRAVRWDEGYFFEGICTRCKRTRCLSLVIIIKNKISKIRYWLPHWRLSVQVSCHILEKRQDKINLWGHSYNVLADPLFIPGDYRWKQDIDFHIGGWVFTYHVRQNIFWKKTRQDRQEDKTRYFFEAFVQHASRSPVFSW